MIVDSSMTNGQLQDLIAHREWVCALAHRLVGDPEVAEDLAQESFLAAMRYRGESIRSSKAWLASVLRNLVRQRIRGQRRREQRERRAARPEVVASTAELVERASTHRTVVDAVLGLPEHYRTALLRRYFDGQAPTEIAEQLQVPVSTVKTRLARALEQLRSRLDREHGGDGQAWVAALVPLARARRAAPIGGLRRSVVTGGAAALVAMVVGTVALWPSAGTADRGGAGATPVAIGELAGGASDPPPAASGSALRVEAGATGVREVVATTTDFNLTPEPVRGRVTGLDGRALAGVVVRFQPRYAKKRDATPIAFAGADGSFLLERVRGRGLVRVVRDDLTTVLAGCVGGGGAREVTVVAAPRAAVSGHVRDPQGRPLGAAFIELRLPAGWEARLGVLLDGAAPLRFSTETGADGVFTLADAPRVDGARLHVEREGFAPWSGAPGVADVTLERLAPGPGRIVGSVVDAAGAPVRDARVSNGVEATRSDADGRFVLPCERPGATGLRGDVLLAFKPGAGPAALRAQSVDGSGRPCWREPIVLRLGRAPLSIAGRVVDPAGDPVAGVRVWPADVAVFTQPAGDDRNVETSGRAEGLLVRPLPEVLEHASVGSRSAWRYAVTDAGGRFVLDGLAARPYRLGVLDTHSLVRMRTEPFAAGRDDVVVRFDPRALRSELRGRVVGTHGAPIAGVDVQVEATGFALRFREKIIVRELCRGLRTVTAADGSFVLRGIPRTPCALRVAGRGVVPASLELAGDEQDLALTVQRRLHLQVHVASTGRADACAVVDETGEIVVCEVLRGIERLSLRRAPVYDGRSEVLSVPDIARTLVLYRGLVVVERVPLQLAAGVVNHVRS